MQHFFGTNLEKNSGRAVDQTDIKCHKNIFKQKYQRELIKHLIYQ